MHWQAAEGLDNDSRNLSTALFDKLLEHSGASPFAAMLKQIMG